MLIENWKTVLVRSWVVRAAALGAALPEVADFLAKNTQVLSDIGMSDSHKNMVRLACLIAVILLRPVRQQTMQEPSKD